MDRSHFVKIGRKRNLRLQALRDYQKLIAEVDQLCYEIRQRNGKYIACKKGCPGNCCQRQITVFPIMFLELDLAGIDVIIYENL